MFCSTPNAKLCPTPTPITNSHFVGQAVSQNYGKQLKIIQEKNQKNNLLHICRAEASGTSSNAEQQDASSLTSNLFGILAVVYGLAWIISVLLPKIALSSVFGLTVSPEVKTTFVGFVAYFPVLTACLVSLKSAVEHDRLGSETYKRLNLALMFFSIGMLINCFTSRVSGQFGVASLIGMHVIVFLVSSSCYMANPFFNAHRGIVDYAVGLFSPANLPSFIYGAISVACLYGFYAFGINASAFIFSKLTGEMIVFMKRSQGIACFLYFMVAGVLKDAANRKRLGASTFKNLNMGMFLMTLSNCLDFVWARVDGAALNKSAFITNEVVTGLAAPFFFVMYFAKKEK